MPSPLEKFLVSYKHYIGPTEQPENIENNREQLYFEDFVLPFGGHLKANNRWVKLSAMMPWEYIEDIYTERMSQDCGAGAISSRIAFGALYIKEYEKLTR